MNTLKLHLGCGPNRLPGWENHDRDVDISKPLPWANDTVDFIFAEHVIEHIDYLAGVRFADECYRVLKPGGALRLSFPDVARVCMLPDAELEVYRATLERIRHAYPGMRNMPAKTRQDCIRILLVGWGHKSTWTTETAGCLLIAAGFPVGRNCDYGESTIDELRGVDSHASQVGEAAMLETTILEAIK